MRKLQERPSLDKYVIFSISVAIIYSIVEFIFSTLTGITHDVLTEWVYKFFAGEVVVCALIKIFKLVPSKDEIQRKLEEATGFLFTQEDNIIDDGK